MSDSKLMRSYMTLENDLLDCGVCLETISDFREKWENESIDIVKFWQSNIERKPHVLLKEEEFEFNGIDEDGDSIRGTRIIKHYATWKGVVHKLNYEDDFVIQMPSIGGWRVEWSGEIHFGKVVKLGKRNN
jgi:hypothetical protein